MTSHITNCIDSILQQHPHAGVMLLGDFNTLNDKSLRAYPLKQLVSEPTRGKATLDKIYTNIADWYQRPITIPNVASSDHCGIVLCPANQKTSHEGYVNVAIRSKSSNGKNLLAHALYNYNWSTLEAIGDLDSKVAYFNSSVIALLDFYLPVHQVKRHSSDKPWITDQFRRLIRQRQYAWTSSNRSKYNKLRNKINRLSKKLRQQFYSKSIQGLRDSSPHEWWRETKKLTGQRSSKSELLPLINSVASGDAQLLADLINSSLQQVSNDLTPLPAVYLTETNDVPAYGEYVVQPLEVFNKLSRIKVRKSPGPDDIPNWFLRDFAFAISEPICHIFNSSINAGCVPSLWKRANVVPIPKSRPPRSIQDDLRPISLTPTLSKILESLVGRWILSKVANKFDARQSGALRGRSTTHALIDITHMWHKALDDRNSIRTLFVDYSKAFDHVDHSTVLRKMAALDIHPRLLKWMHSFLLNRQQRVKVGNLYSDWTTLKGGMPQGTWLGPYVFLILINDLNTIMATFKFVDDVTLTEIIDQSNTSQMQLAADQIAKWSHQNLMIVNTKKTKEMLIGRVAENPPPQIKFNAGPVDRVTSFKLLGIIITDNLSWENHVNAVCAKAGTRLHFLKLLKRSSLTFDDLLLYYKSIIRPVIEYACPVWQSGLTLDQRGRLESIQRRALHIISGSLDYELNCALYDIETVDTRLDILSRQFFVRISNSADCLNHLLPPERPAEVIESLRRANKLPGILCRTARYSKSFLPHALNNYQSS
jgi:hypothetical protein